MSIIDPIELTQKLVRCASITPEDAGAQSLLKQELTNLGFEIFDLPFEGNGGTYAVPNFFARLGTKAPHICFAGHTDVVPTGDEKLWSVPPFSADIVDGKIIGRGTSDMKANICAFVSSISEFLSNYSDFTGSISLLITGDEEAESINGTKRVLEWMKDHDQIPDMCIVGEPTNPENLGDEIKIGRRGSLTGTLTVKGTQGHVAYPHIADNPLPHLNKMLDALNDYNFDKGSEFFPATNLELTTIDVGNTASNVIPAKGSATFNIRFSDQWTAKSLEKQIRNILDEFARDYDFKAYSNAESFITKPNEFTDMLIDIIKKHTDKTPALTTNGGTSDARFVSQYCPVIEFGLINDTIHQIDEHVKIDDLKNLTLIYTEVLNRYFN